MRHQPPRHVKFISKKCGTFLKRSKNTSVKDRFELDNKKLTQWSDAKRLSKLKWKQLNIVVGSCFADWTINARFLFVALNVSKYFCAACLKNKDNNPRLPFEQSNWCVTVKLGVSSLGSRYTEQLFDDAQRTVLFVVRLISCNCCLSA